MKKQCSVLGCERQHHAKGLCRTCYARFKHNGTTDYQVHLRNNNPSATCTIDGCEKKYFAKDLCSSHYNKQWAENNKETRTIYYRKKWRNRNAKLLGAAYDGWVDQDVIDRDRNICQICNEIVPSDLTDPNDPMYPHIDHIVGLSYGGSNLFSNVRLTHRQCNLTRKNSEEQEGI